MLVPYAIYQIDVQFDVQLAGLPIYTLFTFTLYLYHPLLYHSNLPLIFASGTTSNHFLSLFPSKNKIPLFSFKFILPHTMLHFMHTKKLACIPHTSMLLQLLEVIPNNLCSFGCLTTHHRFRRYFNALPAIVFIQILIIKPVFIPVVAHYQFTFSCLDVS